MSQILIAPTAFKGSLSALQVGKIIKKTLRSRSILIPISDGGDSFLQALVFDRKAQMVKTTVRDPLGRNLVAEFSFLKKRAVIELASASGIRLLHESERNPLVTNTYGTGELIREALAHGAKEIVIGIGGSATIDCGTGCLAALGVRFFNSLGEVVYPCAETLGHMADFDLSDLDKRLVRSRLVIACDVDIKLFGRQGAAYLFAGQKGASDKEIRLIDNNLRLFAKLVKRKLCRDMADKKMYGAAGGFAGGLGAFLNARLLSGTDFVFKENNIQRTLEECDAVITGEGAFDKTSFMGKATGKLVELARRYRKKIFVICGICSVKFPGIEVLTLSSVAQSRQESMENPEKYITMLVREINRRL